MPAINSTPAKAVKAQPWKKNWPPTTNVQAGETHGFKAGEILQLEGSAGAHPNHADEKNEQK